VKFRVERDVLAEAVAWAARSLPVRPPVPVLAGLLLEAHDGELSLASFDYEVSGRCAVPALVDEPGRVLVSGRLLADIARSLPNETVELRTNEGDHKVEVTCGRSRFSLLTLPVDDYPALPEMPAVAGTVERVAFASAVGQVAVAAGRDDTLPVLTGVRVEIEGSTITLVATDRYRLAVRELSWSPSQAGLEAIALVPARTLADTAKALTGGDTVTLALAASGSGEGLMGFEGGGRRTTTRLLDGEFPKYRSLLPPESATLASVDTGAFIEAVKRVALVAERNTPVRLSFTGEGVVRLDAGTGEEATASEELASDVQGDDITIAFNPQFLLDGLGAIDAPVAQLAFTTSTKPSVLTGKPKADADASDDYRYLLMPVRLSG
jgi:DNA polymerase-3 subunit beta